MQRLFDAVGLEKPQAELAALASHSDRTLTEFEDSTRRGARTRADQVYVSTGGLFAEAILGRSNGAEYLDMERYFNWQDSPIPHQPPAIDSVSTDSRFQRGEVDVTLPTANLQVVNPVALPDPTGLQGVLAAVQNGAMFRDMSKSTELASIVGSLTALAGQMGEAAATMTGQAAQDALKAATDVSQVAAGLAQALTAGPQAATAGGEPSTITNQGAALNAQRASEQAGTGAGGGGDAPASGAPEAPANGTNSSTSEDIRRKAAGLPPATAPRRNRALNVRLRFESAHGKPITFEALADVPKLFRLFHEDDIREVELGPAQQNANPIFTFPLQSWLPSNGELSAQLVVEGEAFFDTVTVSTIPSTATVMVVRARFASTEQTIVRNRTTTRAQALTELVSTKLAVSAGAGKRIAELLNFGINLDTTDSISDTDTTTGETSTKVTEVVKVPSGGLDITVEFMP